MTFKFCKFLGLVTSDTLIVKIRSRSILYGLMWVVTGGASFIGSHLVDQLVALGARITVADDLSTGKIDNLEQSKDKIKFIKTDLEYNSKSEAKNIFKDNEIVFHLAADHGGRVYITTDPADVCSSFAVDHHVFEACSDTVSYTHLTLPTILLV